MHLFCQFSTVHFFLRQFSFQIPAKDPEEPLSRPEEKPFISLCLPAEVLCAPRSRSPKLMSPSYSPSSVKQSTARLKEDLENCDLGAKASLALVSVNSILLEHNQAHSSACLWLLSCYSAKLGSPRPHGLHSREHLGSGPLQKKFADPWTKGTFIVKTFINFPATEKYHI